jgi:peroxiredoxin Q/BCP
MRIRGGLIVGLAVMTALSGGVGVVGAGDLKVGDAAPAFTLPGSDGNEYSLEQFSGEKVVVLAWFPKAFTGG